LSLSEKYQPAGLLPSESLLDKMFVRSKDKSGDEKGNSDVILFTKNPSKQGVRAATKGNVS